MSDSELGAFLRTRREAITPVEVGLPSGPRRRTPGLRRSELAMLAGVSVEYLTRLEQGRDRNPSPEILAALAEVLQLSHDEHVLLRRSAKVASGVLCPTREPPAESVRPAVQMVLDRLEPTPALLRNRVSDVIAHTSGFERFARPLGLLDARPPNLLRFVFTDARARTVFPDWERVADEHAAMLRAETHCGDSHGTGFVAEVAATAGPALAERLQSPPEPPSRTGVQRVAHPEVGVLRLAYETLDLADAEQHIVVFLAADEASSDAFDRLTGRRPGALHAVGS